MLCNVVLSYFPSGCSRDSNPNPGLARSNMGRTTHTIQVLLPDCLTIGHLTSEQFRQSFLTGNMFRALILTRQKNAGLLTYRWEESPQGPPRKYYSLTDKGREYLASLDEAWEELVGQIQMIRHRENDPA